MKAGRQRKAEPYVFSCDLEYREGVYTRQHQPGALLSPAQEDWLHEEEANPKFPGVGPELQPETRTPNKLGHFTITLMLH